MEVKDIIKNRRLELNLTMKDIADKVGVSEGTVSRWESGEIANMKRDRIVLLANALELSPAVIMGWSVNQTEQRTDPNYPIKIFVSNREQTHIFNYRDLSDSGKDRVDNYTNKIKSLEKQDSDSEIIEKFRERFVARNGNKNLSPDQMRAIMDIIDNADD